MVIIFIEHNNRTRDEYLSEFRFAFNTTIHSSIKTAPAFLNFGRNPKAVNSLQAHEAPILPDPNKVRTQDLVYNMRRREPVFYVKDLVFIKTRTLSYADKNFYTKLAKSFMVPFV